MKSDTVNNEEQYKTDDYDKMFTRQKCYSQEYCPNDGFNHINGIGQKEEILDDPQPSQNAIHLKRRLGLFSGVALIVGTMIGSGIFVSPSGLLIRTGSVGISFIIWIACGVLSLLGALAYAELGTINPSSGAEWAYFMDAFGPCPAFLFSWVSTLVLKPAQLAIICLSFAQYAVEAFTAECDAHPIIIKAVAFLAVISILIVNCYSVNLGKFFQGQG